jgi:hypothetical protein
VSPSPPSSARIYDYYLGGKDNSEADRQAAEQVLRQIPEARFAARANRRFLVRAVQALAGLGVDQFIDLGTGLPTSPNVHEVARETLPDSKVLYVDNDPVVSAHNRALRSTRDGILSLDMDIRNTDALPQDPDVRELLDFTRPVGVLMIAVVHLLSAGEARAALDSVLRWLPDGGYLVLSAATIDGMSDEQIHEIADAYENAELRTTGLTRSDFVHLFDGLDLLPPGITSLGKWRAKEPDPKSLACHCGVARFTR